ncbi:hypothetical protein ABL78_2459 [Leptomonas seymouri]|uniref:Uncharacterized protein n=1 Tax=Leptomonas seymouri TaxID=5684 RepID=A0A0N0P766_LEPSE|nr:hypothetical protein ABL78_2459 [Leptomonas seymouri]|eukprot:KPI88446.1 hypothetical protein ABL78_2459 [Leptomonas seymouri]
MLGCYPSVADQVRTSARDDRSGGVSRLEQAEEEEGGNGLRENRVSAHMSSSRTNTDGPHTPPTVCRHSWLQLHTQDDAPFSYVGEPALHARAREAPFQPSPTSFAPFMDGVTELYGARCSSCPAANRSVAPARYSVECSVVGGCGGRGGSAGRHTVLLGGVGVDGSSLQATPTTGTYATDSAVATVAFAAARPTILMHAAAPPLRRSVGHSAASGCIPREDEELDRKADGDMGHRYAPVEHPLFIRTCAEASATHLTRFSGGSSAGGSSPGMCARVGRPTTLRCTEASFGACQQWGDDGDEEPWMGGATQVWRNSAELNDLAVSTHRSALASTGPQDEDEAVVVPAFSHSSTAGACSQQKRFPFTEGACQQLTRSCLAPHTDARLQSDFAVLFTEEGANEESTAAQDEIAKQDFLTSAVQNLSLTGLEDAPRKSYVRSTVSSPTHRIAKGDANTGAPAGSENTALWGTEEDLCVPPAETKPLYLARLTEGTDAEVVPITSIASQQHDGLHQDGSVAVERAVGGDTTPQGWFFTSQVHQTVVGGSTADSSATADAVAAQLARLSLQASPTQKRLAFEEEEEDGLEGSRSPTISSAPTRSATDARAGDSAGTANCAPRETAFGQRSTYRGRGDTVGRNVFLSTNRWTSDGRVGSLNGLQLLRSRKRCLEEMQATDTEVGARCITVKCAPHPTGAASSAGDLGSRHAGAVVRTSPQEDLKRLKREEQRYERRQHLVHGEANAEDLIPAPMRAGGAPPVYSSASRCPLEQRAYSQEDSQQPLPLPSLAHGDATNWSQLSSISFSTGMTGILSYSLPSQREACPAAGSSDAAVCTSGSCSQVLAPLPTNVTQHYPHFKL